MSSDNRAAPPAGERTLTQLAGCPFCGIGACQHIEPEGGIPMMRHENPACIVAGEHSVFAWNSRAGASSGPSEAMAREVSNACKLLRQHGEEVAARYLEKAAALSVAPRGAEAGDGVSSGKLGEGYPPGWKHCIIRLNPQTGEMHSDGDHSVREWIQNRIAATGAAAPGAGTEIAGYAVLDKDGDVRSCWRLEADADNDAREWAFSANGQPHKPFIVAPLYRRLPLAAERGSGHGGAIVSWHNASTPKIVSVGERLGPRWMVYLSCGHYKWVTCLRKPAGYRACADCRSLKKSKDRAALRSAGPEATNG